MARTDVVRARQNGCEFEASVSWADYAQRTCVRINHQRHVRMLRTVRHIRHVPRFVQLRHAIAACSVHAPTYAHESRRVIRRACDMEHTPLPRAAPVEHRAAK